MSSSQIEENKYFISAKNNACSTVIDCRNIILTNGKFRGTFIMIANT